MSRIAARAMEMAPADVPRYLDRACGADRELRAEAERILKANAGFESLLDARETHAGVRTIRPSFRGPTRDAERAAGARRPTEAPAPTEVVQRSARRLTLVAGLYGAGLVAIYVIRELIAHPVAGAPYDQNIHTPGQAIVGVFAVLSAAVAVAARRWSLEEGRLMALAVTFEVAGGLGIALVSFTGLWDRQVDVWGVAGLCSWILLFTLIMPSPPRTATIAAFASAATAPLAILAWAGARHGKLPPADIVVSATVPVFIVAALAGLCSSRLHRLTMELHATKRLGRYRLVEPLGRGGMGEVWLAEHDLLARPAALKLIRPELLTGRRGSGEAHADFEREAQNTAALSSPHTVRLYDFGLTDDGLFYYVMELLEGLDLEELVRATGPVPPARAVHFLRQVCASLAEAHERGLVHRDIKPSNVFVCRQGLELDFVKVLDFGLARRPRPDGGHEFAGTPGFMAPELWTGQADHRADLYALGCLGYWLVTGEVPFAEHDGTHGMAAADRRPVRPSDRSGSPLPHALESAILACLETDPERRPTDVLQLDTQLAMVPGPAWDQDRARECWSRQLALLEPGPSEPPGGP